MRKFISFYGDDFTGSTDVMEALASYVEDVVLFTRLPSAQEFAPFADYTCIGLAGTSRSQTPDWMEAHLPAAFRWLKSLGADYCHYKVCSTFDSAPHVGNIAKACAIGLRVFQQSVAPLVIGSPRLKRYTFAGHLFATFQSETYRIDRHPVMSRHPVTPMMESDVIAHLALQGDAKFELLDVYDEASLLVAGQALLDRKGFMVGSSGPESALLKALGRVTPITFPAVDRVDRMLVVSGSVSPKTEIQIRCALANGFVGLAVDATAIARGEFQAALQAAREILQQGRSPLIYSACGPVSDLGEALRADARRNLSLNLGRIAADLVREFALKRVVFAGGDTSSHALSQFDIHALTTRFPLAATPGSPLCLAHSAQPEFDGLEIALKGGQVGGDDYFVSFKEGLA